MQRRVLFLFAFLFLSIGCIVTLVTPSRNVQAVVYAAGFEESNLGISFPLPISLDFLPDGRMVVIGQGGVLRVYTGTYAANNVFNQLSTYAFPSTVLCNFEERGLTGLAIDPDYTTNNYIYLFYTRKVNGGQACGAAPGNVNAVHRVSRFVLDSTTSQLNVASETVLLDNIPTKMGTHVSGDLRFGQDGMLYITVGDNSCDFGDITKCGIENTNPQRLDRLLGKMLRINKDGTIPTDNPLVNNSGAVRCGNPAGAESGTVCKEIFAWGLRNPFRFYLRPGTNTFYMSDVGQATWEELNVLSKAGNYGWNQCEGIYQTVQTNTLCTSAFPTYTNPIYAYKHDDPVGNPDLCKSIVGGAFVPPGVWPTAYDNNLFFFDYECGAMFRLGPTAGSPTGMTVLDKAWGYADQPIAARFGPSRRSNSNAQATQALYYTSYNGGGKIFRIRYIGNDNRSPIGVLNANPIIGNVPLTVTFNAAGSSDPDGQPISYVWNYGDGSPIFTNTNSIVTKTYTAAGVYTASLRVYDGTAYSQTVSKTIFVNVPDIELTMVSPDPNKRYVVGEVYTLTATATSGGNTLPDSSLEWQIIKHHDDHTHDEAPTTGNNIQRAWPVPEDLLAINSTWIEVRLKATNSFGFSREMTRAIYPAVISVTFQTVPSNANLSINSVITSTPRILPTWPNYVLNLDALDQTQGNNELYFQSWSDGGAKAHSITSPATSGSVYTATFGICDLQSTTVVRSSDTAANPKCGEIRYGLNLATPGATVLISTTSPIALSSPLTLTKGVTLAAQNGCGSSATLDFSGVPAGQPAIVVENANVLLRALRVLNPNGPGLRVTSPGKATLDCFRVVRQ